MIIDSHAHLKHGDAAHTEYSPQQIVATMDAAGIDKAVVFGICTTPERAIEMARAAAEQFPARLIPYAYGLPSYTGNVLRLVERAVREYGFKGIKIHAGECTLSDYVSDPIFALAGDLGVPCLVDCCGNCTAMERPAAKFPKTRIIVAHLGLYLATDVRVIDNFIALAERRPNVLLDVSGVVQSWKIREAVQRIGSSRIVWGTDGPHPCPDTATFARDELARVRALRLAPADEEAVLGGAIARVLGVH
jgi:predicted TIM-barrel fold metal-dependent hydrolase